MAKNKNIACGILLLVCGFGYAQQGNPIRERISQTYRSQIGIREKTGRNDGPEVERYLKYAGLSKGQPWCAAFVSWCLGQNKIYKVTGGTVALMEMGKTVYKTGGKNKLPRKADVFFIWFAEKNRVAHTGFIDLWNPNLAITVEGNTNPEGSREGDGVYKKRRLKRQIYAVCNYID